MILERLLTPDNVILSLEETDHEEVVQEMIGHLCRVGKIPSGDCYSMSTAVLERESHVGTGLGGGIAIPHARIKGLKETLAVLGRSAEGVDFDSPDNAPCHLIFLLLVPEEKAGQHLLMLAELARVLKKGDLRDRLMAAESAEEICDLVLGQD